MLTPGVFLRATRAKVLPLTIAPLAVGATLAWERTGRFSLGWFAITAAGASAAHLAANAANDAFDDATGADRAARREPTAIVTASGVIEQGAVSRRGMLALAGTLFVVALACGAVLAAARGPVVLWLATGGFLLAFFYAGPPVRYGYRGRGLGEIGVLLAFGVLPVAGSYYVQAGSLGADALWASLVPGLLATLAIYQHHFLHWRADREARKMTPVAVLGPERAMVVWAFAAVAAYLLLGVQAAVGLWPLGALAAVLTGVPLAYAWKNARANPLVQNFLQLLGSTLGAAVLTDGILIAALAVAAVR